MSAPSPTHGQYAEIAEALTAALPGIRITKGQPDEAELAALVASIVSARAARLAASDDGAGSSVWGDPRRRWGVPTAPSRTSWRWSAHRPW